MNEYENDRISDFENKRMDDKMGEDIAVMGCGIAIVCFIVFAIIVAICVCLVKDYINF